MDSIAQNSFAYFSDGQGGRYVDIELLGQLKIDDQFEIQTTW